MERSTRREPGTALVLAGGGALGAYEVGVIHYIFTELAEALGHQPRFNLFAGTSVGALNACILASRASEPPPETARVLEEYWRSLSLWKVLRFSRRELVALLRVFLGKGRGEAVLRSQLPRPAAAPHPPVAGLFDTSRLHAQMRDMISREGLRRSFDVGQLRGLALCATEVCTGRGVVFYETSEGVEYRPTLDPARVACRVEIGVEHAMASAALPFLFPSIQIDGICYTDGALRQNTPLQPVLRMGADRVLVISITQDPLAAARSARVGCRRNAYPGALFLLGKAVNVLLAQSLDHELNRLEMINRLVSGGLELYGPGFLENLDRLALAQRNAPYRLVRTCHMRPSRDLQRVALQAIEEAPEELELPGAGGRLLGWVMSSSAVAESDLLSYLLFTPTYIRLLLELGQKDAHARRAELLRFFGDEQAGEELAS